MNTDLIYPELSYKLQGGFFTVQNEVGLGRPEEIYHQAFKIWMNRNGISFESKRAHPLIYRDEVACRLYPDLVVENKITVELKAKPRYLHGGDWVQLINYLICRNDRLGLLVNMGLDRVMIQRVVRADTNTHMNADWGAWKEKNEPSLQKVESIFNTLYDTHQTGYGREVTDALLQFALNTDKFLCVRNPLVETFFQGEVFGRVPVECIVLDQKIVLCHTVLFDNNDFSRSRAISFMKSLDLPFGLAVNFGRDQLKIESLAR